MNRILSALILVLIILISTIIAGTTLINLAENNETGDKVYTYSVSVGKKTYVITDRTNWTSAPEVYLPEFDSKYVSLDFIDSLKATIFFNITIPTDLIWEDDSVIWKHYKQSEDSYALSYNATHFSVQMTFYHTATVEHFEIRGTR